ncbi:MAG: PAS domain S-box protein [Chlorobiaceae bacterium]|nr:PAS domain S-box protein [Chlorobiaceae bacterium]
MKKCKEKFDGASQDAELHPHAALKGKALLKGGSDLGLLDSIFSVTSDPIFIKNPKGCYLLANNAAARFMGMELSEIIGCDDNAIVSDPQILGLLAMDHSIMETGKSKLYEQSIVGRYGKVKNYQVIKGALSYAAGKSKGMFIILRDVTEFKRAEESVRDGKAILEAALTSMSDAVFISDNEGRFIHFNEAFATFHKFRDKEECAKTFNEYPEFLEVYTLGGELVPVERWVVPRALRGESGTGVEFRLQIKETGESWYGSYNYGPLRDKDGRVVGSVVTARDVSELKQYEQELKNENEKISAFLHNASDGVHILDIDGNLIEASDSFCAMLGYERTEILGKNIALWDKGFSDTGLGRILLDKRFDKPMHALYQSRYLRKEGSLLDVEISFFAEYLEDKPVLFNSARDISERKIAENRNQLYLKQLEERMYDTLQVVANVVEAHDPYTAGHERRVGIISSDIAREMGWTKERCENLKLVGLVHDIGKIGVPTEILSKPGPLSPLEYELVKTHAEHGYEILREVEFPLPIARIIRQHHERMDGSGYPQGLKGDDILVEARIIAVADTLESMSSHRPYRSALGVEAAIREIETHRGKLFDPDVVDAMLRLFREEAYQLPL